MFNKLLFASLLLTLPAPWICSAPGQGQGAGKFNVLFVIIDDHAAGLHSVSQPSPVKTPNMQRLADRGMWFTRAYVASPACCPSRTAFLTGVEATKSGVYYNCHAYRRAKSAIGQVHILPQHFLKHGYLTAGYGKIAHNRYLEDDVNAFTPGHYKMFNRAADVSHNEAALLKQIIPGTLQTMWTDGWTWGALPDDWDRDDPKKLQQDTEFANHTIALLRQKHERPFFVACGFWRPHVSWTVPKRYFDRHPLDSIELPKGYRADDLADVPPPARWLATHRGEHDFIVQHGLCKQCLQGYYASISYVDEQIGRVLDALEAGPNRDNTIVVFTSDNGWHTGEKNHWSKFYLSELACRVVFAISVPGMKPQVCATPVSLIDIYPTLVSLCGLPKPATHELDGVDLTGLLRGATAERGAPVLSTYGRGCHSLRNARFRYTRYRNGDEELYDHENDPHEWTNLAGDARYAEVKARLARALPAVNAPDIEFASEKDKADDINRWEDEAFKGRRVIDGDSVYVLPVPPQALVTNAEAFRIFAEQVRADADRMLAAQPPPEESRLNLLLAMRVHLAHYFGENDTALAVSTRIRDRKPYPEKLYTGMLTHACVRARQETGAAADSPEFKKVFTREFSAHLKELPTTPEMVAVLVEKRGKYSAITRESLLVEAPQTIAAQIQRRGGCGLEEANLLVRTRCRLTHELPIREEMLRALDAAIAARSRP